MFIPEKWANVDKKRNRRRIFFVEKIIEIHGECVCVCVCGLHANENIKKIYSIH